MGWTSYHRDKGQTTADHLAGQLLGPDQRFVATGTDGGTFYAAVRNADGETWGLVVLTQWSKGYYNYTYKAMDEGMGPNESKAPARVLDALSPTTSEYATEWRERCRANLARKAARPKVREGDVVRFTMPLTFTNGAEHDTFTYRGGSLFVADGFRFTITKWRDRQHEVVPA